MVGKETLGCVRALRASTDTSFENVSVNPFPLCKQTPADTEYRCFLFIKNIKFLFVMKNECRSTCAKIHLVSGQMFCICRRNKLTFATLGALQQLRTQTAPCVLVLLHTNLCDLCALNSI